MCATVFPFARAQLTPKVEEAAVLLWNYVTLTSPFPSKQSDYRSHQIPDDDY